MSATDELRRLLDERGVEYKGHYMNTSWHAGTKLHMATDDMDDTLTVDNLTPEQAVAATLGSELNARAERTCHIVKASRKYVLSDGTELFDDGCSECNTYIGEGDNYCSGCGAKVVSE